MYAKSTRPSAKREVQKERSAKRDVQKFQSVQTGYTKYCCFLCYWDSRARDKHYTVKVWSERDSFEPGQWNVVEDPLNFFPDNYSSWKNKQMDLLFIKKK